MENLSVSTEFLCEPETILKTLHLNLKPRVWGWICVTLSEYSGLVPNSHVLSNKLSTPFSGDLTPFSVF